MSSLIRRAGLAAAAVAVCAPAAAQAAAPAPPICLHPSPFAGASFGAQPGLGSTVDFDGSCSRATGGIGWSSVPPDEFEWEFGDGTTGSGPTPSHTYAAPGTYTVKLTEWGRYSGGSTWSISQDVTVLP